MMFAPGYCLFCKLSNSVVLSSLLKERGDFARRSRLCRGQCYSAYAPNSSRDSLPSWQAYMHFSHLFWWLRPELAGITGIALLDYS